MANQMANQMINQDNCLFCKIIKKEIPSTLVFENENVLGFVDIYPQAQKHYLFIHKNHTTNAMEMVDQPEDLAVVFQAIKAFTERTPELSKDGFRIVTNVGKNALQSVFHTHFHVIGGERLGSFGV